MISILVYGCQPGQCIVWPRIARGWIIRKNRLDELINMLVYIIFSTVIYKFLNNLTYLSGALLWHFLIFFINLEEEILISRKLFIQFLKSIGIKVFA